MGSPFFFFFFFITPFLCLWALSSTSSAAAQAARSSIPAIIVFGDSTVDAGNNNYIHTILKSNFGPYGRDFIGGKPTGRFCNGRLPTDFIAEALGLGPVVPAYLDPDRTIRDFATAVCFASAGTGLDNATAGVLNVMPLWKELQNFMQYRRRLRQYLGRAAARRTITEALYIISIGTNDYLENYFLFVTGRFKQFTISEFEDFLVSLAADFLAEIYRLGARRVVFTGLSPFGCLPLERTINLIGIGECNEKYNQVAMEYNAKMDVMAGELRASLPGLMLKINHVYDFVLGLIQNPAKYGFDTVDKGCCATGRLEMGYLCNELNPHTCPDADKYVFWDAFHPTQKVNRLLADFTLSNSMAEFLN